MSKKPKWVEKLDSTGKPHFTFKTKEGSAVMWFEGKGWFISASTTALSEEDAKALGETMVKGVQLVKQAWGGLP